MARPKGLPPDLPLPPGTRFTAKERLASGGVLATGVIPGSLRDAASFFLFAFPKAGYDLRGGDSEQGEAEAPFGGNGYVGQWRINAITDCPHAVNLQVQILKVA